MVRVPVSFIFGAILVTNMTRFQLFAGVAQPLRGFALVGLAALLAVAMQALYRALAPIVAGTDLPTGPPGYALELWIATAMLAVTFPLLTIVSGYFEFWPLSARRNDRNV